MKARQLFSEIRTIYKAYFESKFATSLLAHPELFSSVHKISQEICHLLEKNLVLFIHQLETNSELKKDLYDKKFFGHLPKSIEQSIPANQAKEIIRLLTDENTDMSYVMQLHSVFIYRLYPHIIKAMDPQESAKAIQRKDDVIKKIEFKKEFDGPHRGRIPAPSAPETITTDVGTVTNPVLYHRLQDECKRFSFYGMTHAPAVGRFLPDEKSSFFDNIHDKDVPFVAGASNHTNSYMQCTTLCDLSQCELQEYALACFAFLSTGGNHSFHEVMIVAKQIGVIYEPNNYFNSIPLTIASSAVFAELLKKFPQFLNPDFSGKMLDKTMIASCMIDMANDMMTTDSPQILHFNKAVIASHMLEIAAEMMAPESSEASKEMVPLIMGMATGMLSHEFEPMPITERQEMAAFIIGMAEDLTKSENRVSTDKITAASSRLFPQPTVTATQTTSTDPAKKRNCCF